MFRYLGMQYVVNSEKELAPLAQELLNNFKEIRVFIFEGNLGAGKTTFIKTLAQALGADDELSSPSFGIVNAYKTNNNQAIYHMDCYRLKNEMEAFDIGIDEIVDSGSYCFIEWPDKIHNLLPDNYVRVRIDVSDEQRTFQFRLS